jgi:hypothetical protein
MTESDSLRGFTVALLEDVGVKIRDDGGFLWLTVPEAVQSSLDLPAQASVTFDANRAGEFDAELVCPGGYLLEKLLALATRRGRWDVVRMAAPPDEWVERIVLDALGPVRAGRLDILERQEQALALLAFRTTLTSDEKRESFRMIASTLDGAEGWEVPQPIPEEGLEPATLTMPAPDLEPAYRRSREVLADRMRGELEGFQKAALAALEEEVRRIFHYFDGTVAEIRAAAPSGTEDIVRAIHAERDRRLTEALERFEPHAVASLCSVRIVFVPTARVACRTMDGTDLEIRVDALTGRVRGLTASLTEGGSARPPGRPRSDTPQRRRTAGRAAGQSPRGPRARSRSAAARHRGP